VEKRHAAIAARAFGLVKGPPTQPAPKKQGRRTGVGGVASPKRGGLPVGLSAVRGAEALEQTAIVAVVFQHF